MIEIKSLNSSSTSGVPQKSIIKIPLKMNNLNMKQVIASKKKQGNGNVHASAHAN